MSNNTITMGTTTCFGPVLAIIRLSVDLSINYTIGKRKGGLEWPRGFQEVKVPRKLRFPEYMTTAQDGGKVTPLPPGNTPGTHFC